MCVSIRANICLVLVYLSILLNLQLFAYHKLLAVCVCVLCCAGCMNGIRCILAWKLYRRSSCRRRCWSVEQSALRQCTRQIDIQYSFVVFSMLLFLFLFYFVCFTYVQLLPLHSTIDVVCFYCVCCMRMRMCVYVPLQLATQLLYIIQTCNDDIYFQFDFPLCILVLFFSFALYFSTYIFYFVVIYCFECIKRGRKMRVHIFVLCVTLIE